MSNTIAFSGRLARDPEVKTVGQGEVLEFTVASDVGYGERKTTNWLRCQLWGENRIKGLAKVLKKGSHAFFCGELTIREYDKKDGTKGFSPDVRISVVDLSPRTESSQNESTQEEEEDMPF